MALTEKQKNFCREYLVDLNATLAYQRAGYQVSKESARRLGSKILTNLDVQAEIHRLQGLAAKRTDITTDKTLNTLGAIAFTPITDVLELRDGQVILTDSEEWTPEARMAVESVSKGREGIRVKMHSKTDALGKIMQHLGMLSDLNVALATLKTYGNVEKTEDGYRVRLNAQDTTEPQE
ncbi:MAG: terminase small subunit [Microcoleus sp.]